MFFGEGTEIMLANFNTTFWQKIKVLVLKIICLRGKLHEKKESDPDQLVGRIGIKMSRTPNTGGFGPTKKNVNL